MGVSFVALGDAVAAPEIAALAGVRFVSDYKSLDALTFEGSHFITRGLEGRGKDIVAGGDIRCWGTGSRPPAPRCSPAAGPRPTSPCRLPARDA